MTEQYVLPCVGLPQSPDPELILHLGIFMSCIDERRCNVVEADSIDRDILRVNSSA